VLQIDTPGGLDTSMRDIIKAILASRVPVVAYVAPSGARAASAGTYIVYASHIAAMAPAPAWAPPPWRSACPARRRRRRRDPRQRRKATRTRPTRPRRPATTQQWRSRSDAAAYIRGLAQMRGHNAEWAERAVREP
jgi:membrane-bound serine protease (ClpP class)